MSLQEGFQIIKERLGNPFRKRSKLGNSKNGRKLGENEDDWCDALDYLSVDSDDEYFDALEQQDTSESPHTGTKRKKPQCQTPLGNKLKKSSEMFWHFTSSMSGVGSTSPHEREFEQLQSSQGHSNSTGYSYERKYLSAPSTSTSKKTESFRFGNRRSNTVTLSSSEEGVQIGPKQRTSIDDQPQSQLPMKDYTDKGKFEKQKVTITLMTSWQLSSIEGLKKKLMKLQRFRPDLIEAVKVLELPFSGIKCYAFTEDVDIMVLCHSIENRKLAITNVTDSLYDEFLNYCNKELGKERIAVIAHDFPQEVDEVRVVRMVTFKHTQWSTFEKAGLVMICGMMDKTPEIQEKDWKSLVKFLEDASTSAPTNANISQTTLLKKGTSDTKQKIKRSEKDIEKGKNIYGTTSSSGSGGIVTRSRKPVIYICTSWGLFSVKGLKEKVQTLLKLSFSRYEIREQELPYSRLEDFKFPSNVGRTDAMILCHSVQNRGLSITDVQNSIYDDFLQYCNRVFGRGHMAVIVHDFEDKPEILKVHLETIRRTQPTTYELADLVALAGLLNDPDVKLCHDKSTSLETFIRKLC